MCTAGINGVESSYFFLPPLPICDSGYFSMGLTLKLANNDLRLEDWQELTIFDLISDEEPMDSISIPIPSSAPSSPLKSKPGNCFNIRGFVIIVGLLLEKGADVNSRNYCGHTALMQACRYGHWEVVQTLLLFRCNDPYFRMTCDVAPLLGYSKPALIESSFSLLCII
ncbi:unnamed protein product [Eruca vesicaria subsp. sativa]|uniref:ANK_REP_REGION domain-containing protein n=1 Tax=Eruca vesicaria subsp. sativa TaxID=29727 RepID=A0ABC8KRV4_ERUVS|nr:unnamed protein product [Eruca vesicaria subsp. sativa]